MVELTAMALSLWVSLLSTLLWGCICFPLQKGYSTAHGYSLNDDDFRRHAGVPGPQASNQFHSRAYLHPNQDSVRPKDEMQAMRHQSLVSPQREPVHHENNKRASFVTSLSDERKKSKPESEHDVPSSPPVSKYEREGSDQQPFGLLVKAHTKGKPKPSTSFSTIKDLKRFIETMKSSFLMPGDFMGGHFQTARETIEKEMASSTQNVNNMGQYDKGYKSDSEKEGTAHDDASGNEDWSDSMNTAIEQGSNYQMPSKSLSVPDPVDSTARLISTSVYDNHYNGPGSALYPLHHSAATEDVSSNYGGFDSGGISGGNPDRFTRAPQVRNKAVQSTTYKIPKQIPSGSFFGNDLSFSGRGTASPVNPPNRPSHNFRNYSSKTLTSEKDIPQQPKYTFQGKASLTGDQQLSGLKLGKYVKSQELSRATPDNIRTTPMTPSFTSYGHVVYVSAPIGQGYIPDYQPKNSKTAAKSSRPHQPIVGKQSKYINPMPTAHLPICTRCNNPSPQSSSDLVKVETSSPHNAQTLVFHRKKPVRFYTMRTAQPSSGLHGSSRHDGYLQDQTASVNRPSTITGQPKNEKSDLSKQNQVSATQAFTQKAENVPVSSGLYPTKTGISSLIRVGDAKFNSQTNLAPTSASERPFSRLVANEVMSRNLESTMKSRIYVVPGTPWAPLQPHLDKPFLSMVIMRVQPDLAYGPLKKKPTKLWKHRAIRNKKPVNVVYCRPKLRSTSIMSPSVNPYVLQSRNRYIRSKVSLSKTHSIPSAG